MEESAQALSTATAAVNLVGAVLKVAPAVKNAYENHRTNSGFTGSGSGPAVAATPGAPGEQDVTGMSTKAPLPVQPGARPTSLAAQRVDPERERRAYETVNYVLRTIGSRILEAGLVNVDALAGALKAATTHIEVRLFSLETNRLFRSLAHKLDDIVLVNSVFTSIYFLGFLNAELEKSLPGWKPEYKPPLGPRMFQEVFKAAIGEDAFRENWTANLDAYRVLSTTAGLLRPTNLDYSIFPEFPSFSPCRYSSKAWRDTSHNRSTFEKLVKHFNENGFPQPLQARDVGPIRDWRFLSGDMNSRFFEVEKADKHIGENFGRVIYWLICSATRLTSGMAIIAYYDQHITLLRYLGTRFGYRVINARGDLNMSGAHGTMSKRMRSVFDSWVLIMPSETLLASRRNQGQSQSQAQANPPRQNQAQAQAQPPSQGHVMLNAQTPGGSQVQVQGPTHAEIDTAALASGLTPNEVQARLQAEVQQAAMSKGVPMSVPIPEDLTTKQNQNSNISYSGLPRPNAVASSSAAEVSQNATVANNRSSISGGSVPTVDVDSGTRDIPAGNRKPSLPYPVSNAPGSPVSSTKMPESPSTASAHSSPVTRPQDLRTPTQRSSSGFLPSSLQSPTPDGGLAQLGVLDKLYRTTFVPLCSQFTSNPPHDLALLKADHTRLTEGIMTQIILRLDKLDATGDGALHMKKKALIDEVLAMSHQLDQVYEEGKNASSPPSRPSSTVSFPNSKPSGMFQPPDTIAELSSTVKPAELYEQPANLAELPSTTSFNGQAPFTGTSTSTYIPELPSAPASVIANPLGVYRPSGPVTELSATSGPIELPTSFGAPYQPPISGISTAGRINSFPPELPTSSSAPYEPPTSGNAPVSGSDPNPMSPLSSTTPATTPSHFPSTAGTSPPSVSGSQASYSAPTQSSAIPNRPATIRRKAPPRPKKVTLAKALDDFEPEDEMGEELPFKEGDMLEIVEKSKALEHDGWCRARIQGQKRIGLAPLDYLEEVGTVSVKPPSMAPAAESVEAVPGLQQHSAPHHHAPPHHVVGPHFYSHGGHGHLVNPGQSHSQQPPHQMPAAAAPSSESVPSKLDEAGATSPSLSEAPPPPYDAGTFSPQSQNQAIAQGPANFSSYHGAAPSQIPSHTIPTNPSSLSSFAQSTLQSLASMQHSSSQSGPPPPPPNTQQPTPLPSHIQHAPTYPFPDTAPQSQPQPPPFQPPHSSFDSASYPTHLPSLSQQQPTSNLPSQTLQPSSSYQQPLQSFPSQPLSPPTSNIPQVSPLSSLQSLPPSAQPQYTQLSQRPPQQRPTATASTARPDSGSGLSSLMKPQNLRLMAQLAEPTAQLGSAAMHMQSQNHATDTRHEEWLADHNNSNNNDNNAGQGHGHHGGNGGQNNDGNNGGDNEGYGHGNDNGNGNSNGHEITNNLTVDGDINLNASTNPTYECNNPSLSLGPANPTTSTGLSPLADLTPLSSLGSTTNIGIGVGIDATLTTGLDTSISPLSSLASPPVAIDSSSGGGYFDTTTTASSDTSTIAATTAGNDALLSAQTQTQNQSPLADLALNDTSLGIDAGLTTMTAETDVEVDTTTVTTTTDTAAAEGGFDFGFFGAGAGVGVGAEVTTEETTTTTTMMTTEDFTTANTVESYDGAGYGGGDGDGDEGFSFSFGGDEY